MSNAVNCLSGDLLKVHTLAKYLSDALRIHQQVELSQLVDVIDHGLSHS
jgi:hypothetical protein